MRKGIQLQKDSQNYMQTSCAKKYVLRKEEKRSSTNHEMRMGKRAVSDSSQCQK